MRRVDILPVSGYTLPVAIETWDIVVAGAGPAGLMAGIAAAEAGARVLVLEKMRYPGRKLLLSGSGKCNFSHVGPIDGFLSRYGDHGRFLKPALLGFTNLDLLRFLKARGVEAVADDAGKLFPASGAARDILIALVSELGSRGAELATGTGLLAARAVAGGFELACGAHTPSSARTAHEGAADEGRALAARCLVVATGGRSYPATGSTGDGYVLAASFGHRIVPPAPCLTPVIAADFRFADCAGVSVPDARISIERGGSALFEARGDLLFTHRGLSGPVVLDASRGIRPGDRVSVSLVGSAPRGDLDRRLLAELDAHGSRGLLRCLRALGAAERTAARALALAGLDPNARASTVTKTQRARALEALARQTFVVDHLGGWDEAMATSGGVSLDELRARTMESRLVPGLFFAGEAIDVDGDTGGFNIQAACSTGILAGRSAARRARAGGGARDPEREGGDADT